jgi:DNA polymerase I-like protein with 3'-5' exonuclease and polymerase domains
MSLTNSVRKCSFGILFGSGPDKVAATINEALFEQHIEQGTPYNPIDRDKAEEYIEIYFNKFPQLKKWIKESHNTILSNGFIYSHFGRKRRLRNIRSTDRGIVGEELRSGFNAIIQGASSDVLMLGAIDADKEIQEKNLDAEIVMLVHDSVVAIVREDLVEEYSELIVRNIQKDRGLNFGGFGVGVTFDSEEGGSLDYSCGKMDKQYPELVRMVA